ncbi:hypothetical protein KIPB_004644, partial [Kipferlia bialata]|eukprot:g4644.t1
MSSGQDGIIWECINKGFCSFKTKTARQTMCRNPYNLTGLCGKKNCPLANSRYATVIDEDYKVFLCIRTPERAHLPSTMWEKVEMPEDYSEALKLVDEKLQYMPAYIRHRCKQRLTKITEMHVRVRKLRKKIE